MDFAAGSEGLAGNPDSPSPADLQAGASPSRFQSGTPLSPHNIQYLRAAARPRVVRADAAARGIPGWRAAGVAAATHGLNLRPCDGAPLEGVNWPASFQPALVVHLLGCFTQLVGAEAASEPRFIVHAAGAAPTQRLGESPIEPTRRTA